MDLPPLLIVVIGLVVLGLVWKIISGAFRLVLGLAIVAMIVYFALTYLSR